MNVSVRNVYLPGFTGCSNWVCHIFQSHNFIWVQHPEGRSPGELLLFNFSNVKKKMGWVHLFLFLFFEFLTKFKDLFSMDTRPNPDMFEAKSKRHTQDDFCT